MRALALDERAGVEAIFPAEKRDGLVADALFDRTLDDDIERLRRGPLGDDGFAGAEIANVDGAADPPDLLGRETIEGRVILVECIWHGCSRRSVSPERTTPQITMLLDVSIQKHEA